MENTPFFLFTWLKYDRLDEDTVREDIWWYLKYGEGKRKGREGEGEGREEWEGEGDRECMGTERRKFY